MNETRSWRGVVAAATAGLVSSCALLGPGPAVAVEEGLEETNGWRRVEAAGTRLGLSGTEGAEGQALLLDYDLGPGKLYVVAVKDLDVALPANYRFTFRARGTGLRNNLEFKLGDAEGNVFLKAWRNHSPPGDWQTLTATKRDLRFGWGPNPTGRLERVRRLEIAVAAGEGGTGSLVVDQLKIEPLPELFPKAEMKASASSEEAGEYAAAKAIDDLPATRWASRPFGPQWLTLDLGRTQDVCGLELAWDSYGDYDVRTSVDGGTWEPAYSQVDADGGADEVYFSPRPARFVRIEGDRPASRHGYSLFEVWVKGPGEEVRLAASSETDNQEAGKAMDGLLTTAWHSRGAGGAETLDLDLRGQKAMGGLVIHWGDDYASAYEVEASGNGLNWYPVYAASAQTGGMHKIFLKETEARFLRVVCKESGTGGGYAVRQVELKTADEQMTVTKYYQVAARANPGCYPRWLSNQQAYWTLAGTPDDVLEGALGEDGTIEPFKRGFTIMPLLRVGDRLVTREEAAVSQALRNGYLPIPSVRWQFEGLAMDVEVFAHGGGTSVLYASYVVRNDGDSRKAGRLFLGFRPMQFYPPWQGGTDGFAPIRRLSMAGGIVQVGDRPVHLLTPPDGFAAKGGTFQVGRPVEGDIAADIARGVLPPSVQAEDPDGFASGAAVYEFDLGPGESREILAAIPLHDSPPAVTADLPAGEQRAGFHRLRDEVAAYWDSQVNVVEVDIPDRSVVETLKSYIAYNLITKDGPGFQPGSRSYDKAWIRDGGSAAEALLKMGFSREIREFIDWFGGYQFENGEIPPIIDNKHEDPLWEEKQGLHELDSQGEFVHLVLEYYRFTKDRAFLEQKWPQVLKALQFLAALRQERCTPEYRDGPPEKRIFYGILPGSRSHEGYWLAHSYWDDLWALRGWKDGRAIASLLGRTGDADWAAREYDALKAGVYDSMRLVMELNRIDFIPGCAEKGDFDATSTAEGLVYCDEMENLPQPQLNRTFDRYYAELSRRLAPGAQYVFTPYEMRNVLALLFLGRKGQALDLFHFMHSCRRPPAWNHLAEVVHSDLRFPCYIGDMPHTWVGAEYINSLRGLFVYEKGEALVLCDGVEPRWLEEGRPAAIRRAPTHFGTLSCEMTRRGAEVTVTVSGDAAPPGGFLVASPLGEKVTGAIVNGAAAEVGADGRVRVDALPAAIVLTHAGR